MVTLDSYGTLAEKLTNFLLKRTLRWLGRTNPTGAYAVAVIGVSICAGLGTLSFALADDKGVGGVVAFWFAFEAVGCALGAAHNIARQERRAAFPELLDSIRSSNEPFRLTHSFILSSPEGGEYDGDAMRGYPPPFAPKWFEDAPFRPIFFVAYLVIAGTVIVTLWRVQHPYRF